MLLIVFLRLLIIFTTIGIVFTTTILLAKIGIHAKAQSLAKRLFFLPQLLCGTLRLCVIRKNSAF